MYPNKILTMDVVIIDCSTKWGMLLTRKWDSNAGVCNYVAYSYTTIPIGDSYVANLLREQQLLHNVEYLGQPNNEPLYTEPDLGIHVVINIDKSIDKEVVLTIENMSECLWTMYFDGDCSQFGAGVGAIFVSPDGKSFPYSFRLEFDATNNVSKYEAFLFGSKNIKELRIERLKIKDDLDLFVNQVHTLCDEKSFCFKQY